MRRPGIARRGGSPTEPQQSGRPETVLSGLSRRLFLTKGSLTVVAAGVASALPALPAAVSAAGADAPEADSMISDNDSLAAPLVAQVKDLQSGVVSLYSGEQEFSVVDRTLAARLFNAVNAAR
jgi:hypothetical protein